LSDFTTGALKHATPSDMNRSQFLRRSAKSGLVLVGAGSVLASVEGAAFAQSGNSDLDTAQAAFIAESLAVYTYSAALTLKDKKGRKFFTGGAAEYLRAALKNEKDHVKALTGVIKQAGGTVPSGLEFQIPPSAVSTPQKVLKLGLTLETAFVRAYVGAVGTLNDPALRLAAAGIAANEASHQGFFAGQLGGPGKAVTKSIVVGDTIPNTVAAIKPFVKSPKL
jgi:hypothetical protein